MTETPRTMRGVPPLVAKSLRLSQAMWDRVEVAARAEHANVTDWIRETIIWRLAGELRSSDAERLDELALRVAQLEAELGRKSGQNTN